MSRIVLITVIALSGRSESLAVETGTPLEMVVSPESADAFEGITASAFHDGGTFVVENRQRAVFQGSYGVAASPVKSQSSEGKFDMSAPLIQNKTLYRGVDVKTLSEDQLIDAIRGLKKEAAALDGVGVVSTKIAAKIAAIGETITLLVATLDGTAE